MATATRTTLSSSVTSMDDASIQEFRAAQDRRFQALQGQPQPYPGPPLPSKDPMAFKNAQADSFRANHSHSPPLKQQHKGRSMSVGGYQQPHNASGDTIQRYDALSAAYDETAKRFMHNYNQLDPANRHAIEAHAAANATANASIAASAGVGGAALTRARTMNSVRASSILTQQTATAQANLGLLEMQMRQAEEEIARARETVRGLEAQRDDAERAASHAKKVARRLRAENLVLVAREKGRREGFETGFGHGKALAIARVERERERRRVEAEEMGRRRMLEAAPMPPPPQGAFIEQVDEIAVVQMPEPEPAPASDRAQEPTRRSSLRRPTTAPPPADNQTVTVQRDRAGGPDITVIINNPPQAQTLERSRTVSSTESASTERNATTRQASTAPRSASRVSIVEPPRDRNTPAPPNRSSSVRSSATRDPRRQSTAPSALTSLDSLGVGTPRGMPMEVLLPRMPVAPPMQPQPPAGWVYPDSAEPIPSASTSTAHIPMRPPPGHVPAPISAIELVRPVYNPNPIYPNTAAAPPPDRRDTRTPTSSSSVSTSIRNLHLTNFPTNGAGENRKRELSVIMESHAEGTPSASGSGWTPPYAVPGGSDMDTWRRGSASGSDVGVAPPTTSVEMPVVPPNIPPVQVHLQQQQPAPWPYAPPTNPTSMLGPHGPPRPPRPGSDAPPQPTPSTLHRSSSGSTVEITIEPPSRSASAGLRAHEYDDDDDDDEEDEDHPPPGFVPNNPLPVFARGVPPTGPSQSHPAISGGTPLSIPPGAVTGGTASGFVTEPGRSRPPSGPFHGRTPSFGAGPSTPGFTVEPGRSPSRLANQPSHSTTPIIPGGAPPTSMFTTEPINRPPSRQMGGILGSGVSPAVAASWENGQPAGIVRPSSRQGNANANGNAPGIYAPNPNAASAWGAPTPTVAGWGNILVGQTAEMPRPPSSQGRSLYAPNPSAGAMNSFTVEPGRGRAEPLLGTSPTPNAGFGAFNVEPGRPPSRMGAEIPRPASRQGGAAHGGGARAMGPQFGFGQDAQRSAPATFNYAVPGSAYGAGPTAPQPTRPQAFTGNDRAQGTTLPSIYGPPAPVAAPTYPATQPVPFIPPSIPSSTTTTSHRRRPSGDAGITPGPASASRNRDLENSSSRRTSLSSSTSRGGVGRRQNNQTPHPGANLGRSNPYDQLDDDEGDDMSSLGMATLQNTFQNSGAARRASVYGGAGSMGGASPALSYHPLG